MELINDGLDKISMLKNRDLERQLNLKKKRENKNLISADNEKLDFFERDFAEKQTYILDLINNSLNIPESDLPEHFNFVSKQILTLQKYVAASNIFLRNYDIKKYQNILQDLTDKARQLEDRLLPKKKFGFKNRAKNKPQESKSLNGHSNHKDVVDSSIQKPLHKTIDDNSCGFFNRSNETLMMCGDEILKKDVTVENAENCKIIFKGTPSTLHLSHLRNCQVFTGPVSTSIFAENCTNCTLVITCQQLRLHSSNDVNIYLHVTSRAIMEDCKNIFIAPYNLRYDCIEKDFETAGLDMSVNNWRSVDDFNWLNVEKHSPNWMELRESDRVTSWDLQL